MEKIKELRDKTGAGIVDCKKALEESGGDIEKAVEILRKKGISKAAKRSERETSEGVVKFAVNDTNTEGYMVKIGSETDFVARNEKFQSFGDDVLKVIAENTPESLDDLFALKMKELTVKDTLDTMSGVIGEKLEIVDFKVLKSSGSVEGYSHMDGRICVLVSLDKSGETELARDIAMHIAASDPKYMSPEEVPAEELEKEKGVYREQLLKEGKPEAMLDKIIEGKINKYYEEVCLLKQEFIKDDKKKVEQILGDAKIEKFTRLAL
ncbi:elongation factor Ts [Candidatus Parcubacteria bacterium]|nr:MAG: elongation factor Ts [Candidatus Parcubacteria bacterium]